MDINPSIELELNIYDKIVSVKGYGDDGIALAEELSVKNMSYSDAINCILENRKVIDCMKQDSLLEVTVTSSSRKRAERLRNGICTQTSIKKEHIYCSDNREGIEAAHSAGISFGKYRAFLELRESNPDVSIDDIRDLTMREIRNMMGKQPPYGSGEGCGGYSGGFVRNSGSSLLQGTSKENIQAEE